MNMILSCVSFIIRHALREVEVINRNLTVDVKKNLPNLLLLCLSSCTSVKKGEGLRLERLNIAAMLLTQEAQQQMCISLFIIEACGVSCKCV